MIFQHTYAKVLTGEKTQTRRLVKVGDYSLPADIGIQSVWHRDNRKWQIWHDYAVQPGRGKPAVARIQITRIRCEDVREINACDARAEGFDTWMNFLDTWLSMHDKPMLNKWEHWIKRLEDRPAERYRAWVIEFELVK